MYPLSFEDLAATPAPFDELVLATPDIDRFCSASAWVVSAQLAFHAQQPRLVLRSDAGWAALSRGEAYGIGRFYAALEAMWGLACPFVGPDPRRLAREAVRALMERRHEWDALWLGGIVRDSALFRALVQRLGPFAGARGIRLGPTATRWTASLAGGWDGWLSRRSTKFRTGLRRAIARAGEAGLELERHDAPTVDEAHLLYDRLLAVEARSWKGAAGSGFVDGGMRAFYREMLPRLAASGRLRVVIGRIGERDVSFVFGGVLGDTFRGLQVSFDDAHRSLALGNVMQAMMIMWLGEEGVMVYDLGSDMEYKARWAETPMETVTLVTFRS
ncbi:MAG: GNAT family N-acetyltransferase [Deltaproteobacteria bacterium]|nr:GNAT family N-acetyltransferase [Deltaproteobacteria bacterium]